MNKHWCLCSVLTLFACGTEPIVEPSPNPPPPWGVPVSGGTMLVVQSGTYAVIADPDRDRILAVEIASGRVVSEVALDPGDEPGRVIEDGAGRVHVALRRGGAIVTLATATSDAVALRRAVCPEPRGLAWDAAADALHVACSGGELVTLPASGGEATRSLRLDRDLRDVIVRGDRLLVTRFRSAEVLTIDAQGAIVERVTPPSVNRIAGGTILFSAPLLAPPAVAWRTIALADGSIVMSHQRQVPGPLGTTPGGYGGMCGGGPGESGLSILPPGGAPRAVRPIHFGALPVDIAARPDGQAVTVLYAGLDEIVEVSIASLGETDDDPCPNPRGPMEPGNPEDPGDGGSQLGTPTSIAYAPDGTLLAYYPELPALVIRPIHTPWRTVALTGTVGYDSGRALFHRQTGSGLACASCHPEGREDGLVWEFAELGLRRSQSLAGGILARAPYHWGGDMATLEQLMTDVFGMRMAGGLVTDSELRSLGPWLDRIPAAAPSATDAGAVARGRALFDSVEVGCAECHGGAVYSNSKLYDVGTGGMLKVPSLLGVAARAPFIHDGCAPTLLDRFGPCGGGELHGKTAHLTDAQRLDLVAFLESI